MKRILIPISFSEASANSVRQAESLFPNSEITLLHCYSQYNYNREFNFGTKNYETGIREMLGNFYKEHTRVRDKKTKLIALSGGVSETVAAISHRYDLLVMSKSEFNDKGGFWYSDRVIYIASNGDCPVLLLPIGKEFFNFKNCKCVWHIKRKEDESNLVNENLTKFQIGPMALVVKHLKQTTFKSPLWKAIISYSNRRNYKEFNDFSKANNFEKIDLILLVSHNKTDFHNFMKGEVIQIVNRYKIPILIFQA